MADLGNQFINQSYQDLLQITSSNQIQTGDGTNVDNLAIYKNTTTPHTLTIGTDSNNNNLFAYPTTSSVMIGGTNALLDLYNPTTNISADELIGSIRFRSNDTTQYGITKAQISAHATDTSPDGYLVFSTQQNPTGLAERMRITNTGLVGIGTTTPLAELHISGASADKLLQASSPTNQNILFVSGSGNIGIGTNLPASQLHITGANAIFTLSPIHPLPLANVPSASFATSGSNADLKPYFWNGSSWNALF
jgi:hypothetical protein